MLSGAESKLAPVKRLGGSIITPAEIDATVKRLMKAADVTGVAVAILNEGKIAYLNAFGARDKENHLPLTVDSALSAASFSKVAFAYMVMRLVPESGVKIAISGLELAETAELAKYVVDQIL
jgi:CubicO group peptidase (beta-lactamase class C family)